MPGPATGGTTGPAAGRPADDDVLEWVRVAARAAAGKASHEPGDETVVLDVGDVLAITHWFVITSGRNARQVKTIVDEVEQQVAGAGGPKPLRVEGLDGRQWVLIDYGDFVVHVFLAETRAYYELERLWGDVPRVEWAEGG